MEDTSADAEALQAKNAHMHQYMALPTADVLSGRPSCLQAEARADWWEALREQAAGVAPSARSEAHPPPRQLRPRPQRTTRPAAPVL